jgi:hypothetical protein
VNNNSTVRCGLFLCMSVLDINSGNPSGLSLSTNLFSFSSRLKVSNMNSEGDSYFFRGSYFFMNTIWLAITTQKNCVPIFLFFYLTNL